jgi:hypothetical protein
MTPEEIGGVVRAVVAALGGVLVAKGVVDQATVMAIAGGVATIAVAIWSVLAKRKSG